jgi:demethylmenaquinone methyltransferase/2-methoxy-6-polyprenyl-1,4-benzoquinol methylase
MRVQAMFDRIAPRYDLLNRLISLGLDRRWRRLALESVGLRPGEHLLDVACGTGDFVELALERGARVVGADFSAGMLQHARARRPDPGWLRCDASALAMPDGCIDVVTCGFALRNFVSVPNVLEEMSRVLAPGGRLVLVEVDRPRSRVLRMGHYVWFDVCVPRLGGLLSDRDAYAYLPASTAYLPPANEFRVWLEKAGFGTIAYRQLLFGSAQLWTGVRT